MPDFILGRLFWVLSHGDRLQSGDHEAKPDGKLTICPSIGQLSAEPKGHSPGEETKARGRLFSPVEHRVIMGWH